MTSPQARADVAAPSCGRVWHLVVTVVSALVIGACTSSTPTTPASSLSGTGGQVDATTTAAPSDAPAATTAPANPGAGAASPTTAPTAPASTAAPTTATTVARAGGVLLDLAGSGTRKTETFTAPKDWDLAWTYDCSRSGPAGQGTFQVSVYEGNADPDPRDAPVNQLGRSGAGVEHYHSGGSKYLAVDSTCPWTVKVTGA